MDNKVKYLNPAIEADREEILNKTCAYGMCTETATDFFKEIQLCKPHAVYMNSEWADEDELKVNQEVSL